MNRRGFGLALLLGAALAAGCTLDGRRREVALVACAEAVGVPPPINFTLLGPPRPGTAYVWAAETEVSPIQQDQIDTCMRLQADRPMLHLPRVME
jgi:hypothetical protein